MRSRVARLLNPLLRSPRDVLRSARGMSGEKAAFFASYGESRTFSRTVIELTRALTERGYDVVLIRATSSEYVHWPEEEEKIRPTIVRRPNIGYDFGSWAIGINQFPALAARPQVLLVNDSLVGPFGSIDAILDHFENTTADVWGAASTLQFTPHLQSFMLGFHGGVLRRYPLSRFWASIRELGSKEQIVHAYEIGLSQVIDREMLTVDAFMPSEMVVKGELNPIIDGWQQALDFGFPFVKRELLRLEHFAPLREYIVENVERRFGQNPMDWFETI